MIRAVSKNERLFAWIITIVLLAVLVDQVQEWRAFDAITDCKTRYIFGRAYRQLFTTHVVCNSK
jgi:hypothetical protein